MFARRSLISLGLILGASACADSLTPRSAMEPTPHFLQWAPTAQPQFSAVGATSQGMISNGGQPIYLSGPNGLSLTQYQASFWAVRGESRSLQINYLSATGGAEQPFLRLTTTDPNHVPDRGELAAGDSVLVTVTVDPTNIAVSLEPTGLLFGDPAELQIWYGGAVGDLNGDGLVDDTDAAIEQQLLGLWYQEGAGNPWTPIAATQSLADKSFTSALPHFSGYAVSW